jgi:serine/threonine protein kinase
VVTPAESSRRVLAPGSKLGKYEVIRQIAVGGMAELYLARTVGIEGFEKLVCVKRILPHLADEPSFVNMFLNEARIAATLHHPNVAQIYDIGQEAGEYFFSMEYVHGEDLGRLVATGRENGVPISLDCALTLAAGLCAGLHHAHEKASPDGKPLGVVHRDVSPTNVLVSYDGAVKLVDFGIARAGREPSSQTGLKGKISYMSPEQCRGRSPLDRRSDVFSVGTILYELTTGRLPFMAPTEYGVLEQIVMRDATPPSSLVQGYPPALEAIVLRALARDVDRRYSTALELQNQLEDYAHDNRLRVSPLVLARLMSTLFPTRLEEWDHARSQGAFFVEQHVVRTLIESGKTADSVPGYMPQPLPPADDTSSAVTTAVPASGVTDMDSGEPTELGPQPRPSHPTPMPAPTQELTQPRIPGIGSSHPRIPTTPPGAQPRMTPSGHPRQATPHPVGPPTPPPQMLPPQTLPSQTLPPQTLSPGGHPPAGHPPAGRSARPAPVPNMPGAVPIMIPPPPVPSGGTLVSSATQAGTQPPPVSAAPRYSAQGMPQGVYESPFGPVTPPGGYPVSSPPPGVYPSPPPQQTPFTPVPAPVAAGPVPRDDITEQVRRSDARPTMIVRRQGSRLPIAALAVVGAAGAVFGVWLAISSDGGATPPMAATPTTLEGQIANPEPQPTTLDPATTPDPAAAAPGTAAAAGGAAAPGTAPPAGGAAAPDTAATAGGAAAPGTAATAEPAPPAPPPSGGAPGDEPARAAVATNPDDTSATASNPPPAPPAPANVEQANTEIAKPIGVPGDAKDPKKRPAKLAQQDARIKPAKPKARPDKRAETKRGEARRGQKPEPKEPSWNADSPFLPQATPRR